jgi:hypothetical protein
MDLHLHTPASGDYKQKNVSYLDFLQRAEKKGLDIIAFTDHNTVKGYREMMEEVTNLRLLETLNRILPEERARLQEYERLFNKILILPGFEFTATFGFHILGIFPPDKPIRDIEHLLLKLNVPSETIDDGAFTVGASSDVLTAYREINMAGGLVIAAHVNSSNGVAMRGINFGGQTKIAYTQDPNLHALEVTDLEIRGRRTTATFFNGTKPEYPRRMHCIQGSDAHRLDPDPSRKKELGLGDRTTEILMSEVSFENLLNVFNGNDFSKTRPSRKQKNDSSYDFIQAAREEGANIIQDFHVDVMVRGGHLYNVIADTCALANTNGGTLYIGVSGNASENVVGVEDPSKVIQKLEKEINNRISPPLNVEFDSLKSKEKPVVRVMIPRGDDPPYAVDDNKIYVREESDTSLAVRDEIVGLVNRAREYSRLLEIVKKDNQLTSLVPHTEIEPVEQKEVQTNDELPRTGVEVIASEERQGSKYYTLRDLRNGNVVKNVTEKSARKLWHYAITKYSELPQDKRNLKVEWHGNYGLLQKVLGKTVRYDFVENKNGNYRFFYGVTEDGISGPWNDVVGITD